MRYVHRRADGAAWEQTGGKGTGPFLHVVAAAIVCFITVSRGHPMLLRPQAPALRGSVSAGASHDFPIRRRKEVLPSCAGYKRRNAGRAERAGAFPPVQRGIPEAILCCLSLAWAFPPVQGHTKVTGHARRAKRSSACAGSMLPAPDMAEAAKGPSVSRVSDAAVVSAPGRRHASHTARLCACAVYPWKRARRFDRRG